MINLSYLNDENIETINSVLDNREESKNILKQLTLTHQTDAYYIIIFYFSILICSIGVIFIIYFFVLKGIAKEEAWSPILFTVVSESFILVFHFIFLAKNRKLMNYILDTKINLKQNEVFLSCTLFMNIEVYQLVKESNQNSNLLLNTQCINLLFDKSFRYVFKKRSKYSGEFQIHNDYSFIDDDIQKVLKEFNNEYYKFNEDQFCKIFFILFIFVSLFLAGISLFMVFVIVGKRKENLLPGILLTLFIGITIMMIILSLLMNYLYKPFYQKIEEINKINYETKGIFIFEAENFIFKKNKLSRMPNSEILTTNDNLQNNNINELDSSSERPLNNFESKLSYNESKMKISEILKISC